MSGSVEAACGLGLADAVVDLVETGTTMKVGRRAHTRSLHATIPSADYHSYVCLIGSTHKRLRVQAAGLDVVSEVMVSQAVLICNPQSQHQELIALILKRIEGYITATQYMMISYNVTRSDLTRALAVRYDDGRGRGGGGLCVGFGGSWCGLGRVVSHGNRLADTDVSIHSNADHAGQAVAHGQHAGGGQLGGGAGIGRLGWFWFRAYLVLKLTYSVPNKTHTYR